MNKFIVLFAFAVAIGTTHAAAVSSSSSSSSEEVAELAQLLSKKFNTTIILDIVKMVEKAEDKCPNIEEKIEGVVDKVDQCMDEIELGSDTFCSLVKNNLAKCSKPLVDLITSCLPDESKDLPPMVQKIITAVVDEACHTTVEELLELLNPCIIDKEFVSVPACSEIKDVFVANRNKLPSKSLVCSMLPKVKTCVKGHVEASCKNPTTKRATLKFHEAIDNAIKSDCEALNKV
ncbi:unnamed protein product [Diabrotica balteata]|uniref:Uncharacterized protein n=1 Tax=Diabrotica balteata TaxID=107213 RepID=A0A9N9XDC9_DIABA|nr:unnamed protein product [Diabrotica balteata]